MCSMGILQRYISLHEKLNDNIIDEQKYIYIALTSAFQCILHGNPLNIPMEITGEYV